MQDLDREELHEETISICPVMGSLLHEESLGTSWLGRTSLVSVFVALRGLGLTIPLSILLLGLVPIANGFWYLPYNLLTLSVDLRRMAHHLLDHRADSGVLHSGTFNPEAFSRLAGFSRGKTTMTVKDVADLVQSDYELSRSWFGHIMALVEFATLIRVFGVPGQGIEQRDLRLPVASLLSLYRPQVLPPAWTPLRQTGVISWAVMVRKLARATKVAR